MQEETEVLGENLRGQVWIENQIHIRLWPDWESNPGRIGERHGNNRCANPPAQWKIRRSSEKSIMLFDFESLHLLQPCIKSINFPRDGGEN